MAHGRSSQQTFDCQVVVVTRCAHHWPMIANEFVALGSTVLVGRKVMTEANTVHTGVCRLPPNALS